MPLADLWTPWRRAWVLHEDADLLVVDKPAGMSTHAAREGAEDDVVSRIQVWLRARSGGDLGDSAGDSASNSAGDYLGTHQRLDKETSGVLLFTRRREANPSIAKQFEERRVRKTYVAVVERSARSTLTKEGELRHVLVEEAGGMRVVASSGRDRSPRGERSRSPRESGARGGTARERGRASFEAITRYRLIAQDGARALVELEPVTGRTHQLRAQLAAAGAPIVGDDRYGAQARDVVGGRGSTRAAAPRRDPRLLLHATRLRVVHPATGAQLDLASKPPFDLRGLRTDIAARIREAAQRRYGVVTAGTTDAVRLVHGVADGLDGVTIDVYGEHLVVSLASDEAEVSRDDILAGAAALGARGVYIKSRPKHASRVADPRRAEIAPRHVIAGDDAPERFAVRERGCQFWVRLGEGLQTGLFLDQRENRARVEAMARDLRVLNLFSYTGSFTIAAIAGGARATTSVDNSAPALAWARENLELAGADLARHHLVKADALVWLKAHENTSARYDLVVLDPPSFATTRTSTFTAASDYTLVAASAMRLLTPGGALIACTNHSKIGQNQLRRLVHDAGRAAGRAIDELRDLGLPDDFPVAPGAEPHMKSVLARVGSTRR